MNVSGDISAGANSFQKYVTGTFYSSYVGFEVMLHLCRWDFLLVMLVDLSVAIMQVAVSFAIMQLENSAALKQVTVSAANM